MHHNESLPQNIHGQVILLYIRQEVTNGKSFLVHGRLDRGHFHIFSIEAATPGLGDPRSCELKKLRGFVWETIRT